MKNLLLFVFSLMTGFKASSGVKGCLEFICKYSRTNETYQNVSAVNSTTPVTLNTSKQSIQYKEWETKDSLSQDKKNKNFGIIGKKLNDTGTYNYNQSKTHTSKRIQIVENKDCQMPFHLTAYLSAPITIRCDYLDPYYYMVKFICKVKHGTCEEISEKSISFTKSSYSVSLQNLTKNHAGVYWCGVKDENGVNRTAVKKIELKVKKIAFFTKQQTIGQNVTYFCKYEDVYDYIFICKGEDPSICQPLVNTTKTGMNKRFSMKNDESGKNITITVTGLTRDDSGTYWCGAKSTDKQRSNRFFHRMTLTVVSGPPPGTSVSVQDLIACIVFLSLLLLVILFVHIYKRFYLLRDTSHREAEQHPKEDNIYEEIQECLQMPESVTSISATASVPSNNPSSLHYAVIDFESRRAHREGLLLHPSSPSSLYSAVRYSQSPTYLTVN